MKTPLVATRASKRVPKHGVFVMHRGETRASQFNDLSGNANPFAILNSVSRDKLMEVASHSHVVLGKTPMILTIRYILCWLRRKLKLFLLRTEIGLEKKEKC
jgi:hypothetical protein